MFGIIFNNASQGMMAMSHGMGTISQNIANVNTQGYKHKETLFQTTLSGSHASSATQAGGLDVFGVVAYDRHHIQNQGQLRGSSNWSDLAIQGRGFFMVSPAATDGSQPVDLDINNPDSVLYTRDGGFGIKPIDETAYLTLGGGSLHLMGWQADEFGVVDETQPITPVNYTPNSLLQGISTTSGKIIANLPAGSKITSPMQTSDIAIAVGGTPDINLNIQWNKADGNSWNISPNIDLPDATVEPASIDLEMDVLGNVDPNLNLQAYPMTITYKNPAFATDPTAPEFLEEDITVDLTNTKPEREYQKIGMQIFDSNQVGQDIQMVFEHVGINRWHVYPGLGGNVDNNVIQEPIVLEFTEDGQIISTDNRIDLNFEFIDGNPPVPSTATMSLDIAGLTQYNTSLITTSTTQDGYPDGYLRDIQFDDHGNMIGIFDNSQARTLYRLPLSTFVSENNLLPLSGNLFARTEAAGDINVASVENTVGNTSVNGFALEGSTVDIGDEFTKMIITQRAYSTNAKVFTTADEMTTVARDLKS